MWREMTSHWPDYDDYQRKTDREIAVVVLERGLTRQAGSSRRSVQFSRTASPPASTSVASALPTPSTSGGAERVAQRPGEQVADRQQHERAHPVVRRDARERVRRHALGQRGVPPDAEQRQPDAGGREQRHEHEQRRAEREADGDRRGHGSIHRKPARIGCSGRQRKPSTAPSIVPAPIARPAGRRRRAAVLLLGDRRAERRPRAEREQQRDREDRDRHPDPRARAHLAVALAQLGEERLALGRRSPRSRGRTRARKMAETRKVTASIANAQPAPSPSTSAVASAGPANSAIVSSVLPAALASWISSSGTVCGHQAGVGRAEERLGRPEQRLDHDRCQISIASVKISAASRACSAEADQVRARSSRGGAARGRPRRRRSAGTRRAGSSPPRARARRRSASRCRSRRARARRRRCRRRSCSPPAR